MTTVPNKASSLSSTLGELGGWMIAAAIISKNTTKPWMPSLIHRYRIPLCGTSTLDGSVVETLTIGRA